MRVAYVCADAGVPVFGTKGSSVHVQAVAGALARRGARVELLATRAGGDRPAGLGDVHLHPLPPAPKGEPAARERLALSHNAALAEALDALGGVDLVYERYSLWSHAGMEWARDRGVPSVLEVNAPLIDEQAEHRDLVDRAGAERVATRACAAADAIVAVSEGVAAWLAGRAGTSGRVHVLPNGVDPARFPAPSSAAPRPFTVGFLGTLKPWHGLDTLVEAFALLHAARPEARLLVVGDGPLAPRLREDLDARGLADAATFAGAVDPSEVPVALQAMDVAVAPYPDLRPFYFSPLKVVEAMAAGRAVVCSRVGDVPRIVQHGETGVLCPPGDAVALAAALRELADDPARRARLGDAARERVLARHTWDALVERVLALAGVPQPAVAGGFAA